MGEYTVFAHILLLVLLLLLLLLVLLVLLPKSSPRRHAFILGPNDLKFDMQVHFTNTPTRFFIFLIKSSEPILLAFLGQNGQKIIFSTLVPSY